MLLFVQFYYSLKAFFYILEKNNLWFLVNKRARETILF